MFYICQVLFWNILKNFCGYAMIKINFYLEEELLEEIEKYWHEKRLKSRTEAIRELLRKALEEEKKHKNSANNHS